MIENHEINKLHYQLTCYDMRNQSTKRLQMKKAIKILNILISLRVMGLVKGQGTGSDHVDDDGGGLRYR